MKSVAIACVMMLSLLSIAARAPSSAPSSSLNDAVLAAARSYPDAGGYNLKWAGSGTPEEVLFGGQRILAKGTDGTYCCGFTFAVMMKVARERDLLAGKSVEQVRKLQKEWYGAVEDKVTRERQCAVALEHLGIGREVKFDDARPGDFGQLWREKSGHSVIFLGWAEKDGKRVGLRYRSSQGSTKGIGDKTEYFRDSSVPETGDARPGKTADVDRARVYFGRLDSGPSVSEGSR